MESSIQLLITIFSSIFAFILFIYYQFQKPNHGKETKKPVPRAAGALPIIGHLHHFSNNQLLHRTLGAMAEKHGPAFTIMLGSQQNLVISSFEMAKECFTTLDKVFSNRPKIAAARLLGYNFAMFGLAPYGPYWREMRRITSVELLSHRRLDMLHNIRISEVKNSLKEIYDSYCSTKQSLKTGVLVDMKQWFGDLTLNATVRMVGGKRFGGTDEARSHQKIIRDYIYYFGVVVLSDAIPLLGWLDLGGHEKTMKRIAKELDILVGGWLEEHKQRRRVAGKDKGNQDLMDVILSIFESANVGEFDADTINKATCLNLVVGGTDTSMVTLTWALTLLVNNPHVMKKAREEVDTYVGKDRHVEESDIKNLVYLQAIVKETLRLFPPIPVIGLHSSTEDCTISPGYHVPSGTRLMVNIWKIQRDENLWPEPLEFKPERFLTTHKDIDVRGHNYELLPFGSGRRSCPGVSLALQTVHFTLANLLHCFEFAKPSDADLDMTESPGLTSMKATPLEVYITPRLNPEIFAF